MNIKDLLIPKQAINNLPDNRVKGTLILLIIATFIITFLSTCLINKQVYLDLTKVIQIAFLDRLAQINPNERLQTEFGMFTDLITMFIFCLLVYGFLLTGFSWIVKKILAMFKKTITIFKLINIHFYSIFYTNLIGFLAVFLYPLIPFLKPYTAIASLLALLLGLLSWLFPLIIYIYGIKITIKNQQ